MMQRRSETYSRDLTTLCYLRSLFPRRVAQRYRSRMMIDVSLRSIYMHEIADNIRCYSNFTGIKGDIVDVSLVTMELGNEGSTLTAVLSKNDEKTLITLFQLPNSIVEKS